MKPIVAFVSPEAPHVVNALNRAGVPTFAAPESCVAALVAVRRTSTPKYLDDEPPRAVAAPEGTATLLHSGTLNEFESKRLFAAFGIPVTREIAAATPEEAQSAAQPFDSTLVVKILTRDVLHKTEAGGVALDVSREGLAAVCTRMAQTFTAKSGRQPDGFLVQERIFGGIEMILGMRRDPQFGPVVMLGVGGIAAELIGDKALRLAPVSRRDAQEMIAELKTAPLLNGYRGRPRADAGALAHAIVAFSDMALALGERLTEAEINPLFVLPEGRGVVAADGVVIAG